MTSVQYEVAVPMGDAKPPIKPVDKTDESSVYCNVNTFSRQDAVEFFAMLRCAFLQVVRWIERKYPESVK